MIRPFLWSTLALLACMLAACTPAGPKALLDGKAALDEGDSPSAVKRLETAVTLMPTNAQAFNYLGLAYHMAGQITNAQKAYQRAMQLNPDLSEARYNLGCLYLEVNRLDAAKGEFTAYTLRLPKVPGGWIKLATAQHRMRDYLNAERSFNEALRLTPGNVEALNGLGLARLQRGRVAEARQSFEAALQTDPNYPPALLNLAVLHHQTLKDSAKALALYKRYSALQPAPPRAGEVNTIITQLERASIPVAPAPVAATALAAPLPASNAPAPTIAAIGRVNLAPTVTSPPPAVAVQPPVHRPTAVASAATNAIRTSPPGTPVVRTTTGTVRVASSPVPPTAKPSAAPPPHTPAETVVLADEPQVRSAQDSAAVAQTRSAAATAPSAPLASQNDPRQSTIDQPEQKRGLLRKLNPLNLLPDKKKNDTPVYTTAIPQPIPQPSKPEAEKETTSVVPAPASFARYSYRSPGIPRAGDRPAAERALAAASAALKAQRPSEAVLSLRAAAESDPAFFEAHYNLGVVLTQAGDAPGALASYENALAIRPQSTDARYNFALLLKQSGYALDAASELEKLLKTAPNEARAHLAAGNIYADQLRQPARARPHYQRFLELDPRSSQAGAVRYWLTTKPAGE